MNQIPSEDESRDLREINHDLHSNVNTSNIRKEEKYKFNFEPLSSRFHALGAVFTKFLALVSAHPVISGFIAILGMAGVVLSFIGFSLDRQEARGTTAQIEDVAAALKMAQWSGNPELDLGKIVMSKDKVSSSDLKEYLAFYRFEKWIDRPGFETYLMYAGTGSPSWGPRIILILAEDISVVGASNTPWLCAVQHAQNIDLNSDEVEQLSGGFTGTFTFTPWCAQNYKVSQRVRSTYFPILQSAG